MRQNVQKLVKENYFRLNIAFVKHMKFSSLTSVSSEFVV